ncbi:MAG: GntR family transcriptional regulator [Devosia sp.]|nr:GntR family transcriptional regulator [Devosia sp.]
MAGMVKLARPKELGIDRIRNGVLDLIQDLHFGDKLPTEEKLSALFNVSRPALREGLKQLEQEGVIDVVHGKGRFVAAGSALSIARPITKFESVTDMVATRGYETTTQVLGFGVVQASAVDAGDLGIPKGSPLLRIERLRKADGEALIYSVDLIPRDLLPDDQASPQNWVGSLVELLAARGLRPVASTANISAVELPQGAIELHGLHDFGPALKIREICFTERGQRVVLAEVYHSGKAFAFSFVRR